MGSERLKELLETGSLFFRRLSKFDDRFEGLLTEQSKNHLFRWALDLHKGNIGAAKGFVNANDEHRNNFHINCWHMNSIESYLMWRCYAQMETAIQTTYERLVASFDSCNEVIEGTMIEYTDYDRERIDLGNVYSPIKYKSHYYRDEKEYRLIFWEISEANKKFQVGDDGVIIKADLDMLIEKIYLNPLLPEQKKIRDNYKLVGLKVSNNAILSGS
ncbi:MAG: hypothetical protein HZA11_00830 [Nitrospirae bacterium]|nr:hypothetical protein [Nitrospirota bacterium]